jgi:hypothetical protein
VELQGGLAVRLLPWELLEDLKNQWECGFMREIRSRLIIPLRLCQRQEIKGFSCGYR